MILDSLEKLYVHELKDLYSAENQLLEAIPKMAEAANDASLRGAFEDHLDQTKEHVLRIEKLFDALSFAPGGHKCAAMEGLIEEGADVFKAEGDPEVIDAALIACAQRIEHYEMAAYGTAAAFAEKLGRYDDADLLHLTLEEEGKADRLLSRVAHRVVNFKALTA